MENRSIEELLAGIDSTLVAIAEDFGYGEARYSIVPASPNVVVVHSSGTPFPVIAWRVTLDGKEALPITPDGILHPGGWTAFYSS